MKITWYGHSCFYIETRGIKLLFDPYPEVEDDLIGDVDYILVTHEHSDHYGKTPLIARLRDATVIGPKPVYLMAIADGITKVEEVEWGEEIELEGGVKVKVVYEKPRRGDIKRSYADIRKIRKVLGFKPKTSLESGLEELFLEIKGEVT